MNDTISGQVLSSIQVTGTGPSLVQQCHFLEQSLGTSYTDMILSDSESVPSNRTIRDQLIKLDIARCTQMASERASLRFFSSVCQKGSWMAIWDAVLEHGSKGTRYTRALLRALSQPVFGDRRCPLSNILVAIAASLKMSQLWSTSATVTVSLLMLIATIINAINETSQLINPQRACAQRGLL